MVDVLLDPIVATGGTVVPPWARSLTPAQADTRQVSLAGAAQAVVEFHRGEGAGFVSAVVAGARSLNAGALRRAVAEAFTTVLERVKEEGFATPARMWNFVPGIHGAMGPGLDRYRVFNLGRYDAFSSWFAPSGAAGLNGHAGEVFSRVLPAASAVGHAGDHLFIGALALAEPGRPLENPRQVPAFAYSTAHGPRPPCFARATVADLPTGTRLLVSGTASIRGEDSLHAGSLEQQVHETFVNLEHLLASARAPHRFTLAGVDSARVYFPRPADRIRLAELVAQRLPSDAPVEFYPAWICRDELLVEIEATVAPAAAGAPQR